MAVKVVTPETLTLNTFDIDALATVAATAASDGFTLDCSNIRDDKLLLIFENTDVGVAYDVTLKAGNSIQGVGDKVQEIAATKTAVICVDSGAYKNVDGTNKGLIKVVVENVKVQMAAVVLP